MRLQAALSRQLPVQHIIVASQSAGHMYGLTGHAQSQAMEKLKLDTDTPAPGTRPKALGMISCVGTEYVPFKAPLPLEHKVTFLLVSASMNSVRPVKFDLPFPSNLCVLLINHWW